MYFLQLTSKGTATMQTSVDREHLLATLRARLEAGEHAAIVGVPGSGTTTLLRTLVGSPWATTRRVMYRTSDGLEAAAFWLAPEHTVGINDPSAEAVLETLAASGRPVLLLDGVHGLASLAFAYGKMYLRWLPALFGAASVLLAGTPGEWMDLEHRWEMLRAEGLALLELPVPTPLAPLAPAPARDLVRATAEVRCAGMAERIGTAVDAIVPLAAGRPLYLRQLGRGAADVLAAGGGLGDQASVRAFYVEHLVNGLAFWFAERWRQAVYNRPMIRRDLLERAFGKLRDGADLASIAEDERRALLATGVIDADGALVDPPFVDWFSIHHAKTRKAPKTPAALRRSGPVAHRTWSLRGEGKRNATELGADQPQLIWSSAECYAGAASGGAVIAGDQVIAGGAQLTHAFRVEDGTVAWTCVHGRWDMKSVHAPAAGELLVTDELVLVPCHKAVVAIDREIGVERFKVKAAAALLAAVDRWLYLGTKTGLLCVDLASGKPRSKYELPALEDISDLLVDGPALYVASSQGISKLALADEREASMEWTVRGRPGDRLALQAGTILRLGADLARISGGRPRASGDAATWGSLSYRAPEPELSSRSAPRACSPHAATSCEHSTSRPARFSGRGRPASSIAVSRSRPIS